MSKGVVETRRDPRTGKEEYVVKGNDGTGYSFVTNNKSWAEEAASREQRNFGSPRVTRI